MAELLFAQRKARTKQIRDHLISKGMDASDRKVNEIRLNATGHASGINPVWAPKSITLKDNDLSAEAEKELVDTLKKNDSELRRTMTVNGMMRFTSETDFMRVDEPVVEKLTNTNVMQLARDNYRRLQEQQQMEAEGNRKINRLVANHMFNIAKETPISKQTCDEMNNSDVDIKIGSQREYLQQGHGQMYQSSEYQEVLKRRKDIKLCEEDEGVLSESAKKTAENLLKFDSQYAQCDEE